MKPFLHNLFNEPITICLSAFEAHMKAKIPKKASAGISSETKGEKRRCSEAEIVSWMYGVSPQSSPLR